MEQTEQKLKIEKEILDLKRVLKITASEVDEAKREYNAITAAIQKNSKMLEEQKGYLNQVLNDISDAKLKWALEKDEEWQKINKKSSEADVVLAREKELDAKERKLVEIDEKTTASRNEMRSLSLKAEADKTLIEVEKREISRREDALAKKEAEIIKLQSDFKDQLKKIISEHLNG